MERVDEELQAKRDEFKKRMEDCAEKQINIQKKQQQVTLITGAHSLPL